MTNPVPRKLTRRARLAAVGVLAGIIFFALLVYPAPLNTVKPHFDGTCRSLPIDAGGGDITVDAARGVAYLTYLDAASDATTRQRRGTVMLVDLNVAEPRVRAALVSDPPEFRPVALSLYAPTQGAQRLFVVNHDVNASSTVEIFEQSATGAFALVKTVRDPLLAHARDVAAVGLEQFYATNDPGRRQLRALVFPSRQSSVVYFDGKQSKIVAAGLRMASGIALSADGRAVYVGEMADKRLRLFDRDANSGALRPREAVSLGSAPDHLSVDADGDLWIAAHPRLIAALRRFAGASVSAPTQVLKFSPLASANARVTEVYADRGVPLSAGTGVVAQGKRLLIGSATDHKLLLCQRSE